MTVFTATRTGEAVSRRFAILLARIQPSTIAQSIAAGRADVIKRCLRGAHDVHRPKLAGSFYKGTAISGASDVDLFLALTRHEIRWGDGYKSSTTVLGNIRSTLQQRYPHTAVNRDGVAIRVSFATGGVPIDVVPAVFDGLTDGRLPVYAIPDGDGDWMPTSPDATARHFRAANIASAGKLARTVQLIKCWARCRPTPIPISSYYVEMVLAGTSVASGARRYSEILSEAFTVLTARGGASLRDPLGIGELIQAANTDSKIELVMNALARAAGRARDAVEAEDHGRFVTAVDRWRLIFNYAFAR